MGGMEGVPFFGVPGPTKEFGKNPTDSLRLWQQLLLLCAVYRSFYWSKTQICRFFFVANNKPKTKNIARFFFQTKVLEIPFLPKSWKWKMGPSNTSFLSFRVVFHFHDYGRESISFWGTVFFSVFQPVSHFFLQKPHWLNVW